MNEWKKIERPAFAEKLLKASEAFRAIATEVVNRDAERLRAMTAHLAQREKEKHGDLAAIQPE